MSNEEDSRSQWNIFKPERTSKTDLTAHLFYVTKPAKDMRFRDFTAQPPSKEYRKINISQEKRYWELKDKLYRLFWRSGRDAVIKEPQSELMQKLKFIWLKKKKKNKTISL